ncbi:MAG: UpxY family transcription antiterminator [Candidatus Aureabacteria bacterium]|nr:UpxY family transcription antiterminator [Candidatus Auribacterota bacterium]
MPDKTSSQEQKERDILTVPKWYAVHSRSRFEKKVAALLIQNDITTYLPVRRMKRKWKDRKKIIDFPLFPCYLFVHIPLLDKKKVIQTKGVVKLVGFPEPAAVPDNQIEALKRFETRDIKVDPYPEFIPGKEIEVKRGPFRGIRGYVIEKNNRYRLVVGLELISQVVSVEIDVDDIRTTD